MPRRGRDCGRHGNNACPRGRLPPFRGPPRPRGMSSPRTTATALLAFILLHLHAPGPPAPPDQGVSRARSRRRVDGTGINAGAVAGRDPRERRASARAPGRARQDPARARDLSGAWRRIFRGQSFCAHSRSRALSFSSALASTTFHSSSGSASAHARILRFNLASTLRPISSHSCRSRRDLRL